MDPLLDFTGKSVLITGAAQGFGYLIAESLAQRGAKLIISDINEAGINEVAKGLSTKGYEVIGIKCDVAKEAQCQHLVEAAIKHYGQLDIAINNAGIAPSVLMPLHLTDEHTIDRQFSVNVKGVQFGMKHQITQMLLQNEGVILNVSSMAGLGGAAYISSYAAAKHAVLGLTKSAAVEYATKNIRINAVCQFFTLTKMVTDSGLTSSLEALSEGTPMKRLAKPAEIVDVMLMLISPKNTYMTGQCIAIDGGLSAC